MQLHPRQSQQWPNSNRNHDPSHNPHRIRTAEFKPRQPAFNQRVCCHHQHNEHGADDNRQKPVHHHTTPRPAQLHLTQITDSLDQAVKWQSRSGPRPKWPCNHRRKNSQPRNRQDERQKLHHIKRRNKRDDQNAPCDHGRFARHQITHPPMGRTRQGKNRNHKPKAKRCSQHQQVDHHHKGG